MNPAHARPAELKGLVLAGGRSERLGRDKATIPIQGQPQLARAVELLGRFIDDVRVAVRGDQQDDSLRASYPLVVDTGTGIGPAAGILGAHLAAPHAAWLVLACDMPWVSDEVVSRLVAGRDPRRAATAFRGADCGLPEPLCAIYEPATLARFQRQVAAGGSPSPRDWLVAADPLLLGEPRAGALNSINTPEDLQALAGTLPGAAPGTDRARQEGSN